MSKWFEEFMKDRKNCNNCSKKGKKECPHLNDEPNENWRLTYCQEYERAISNGK